ncbi:uncharacterized protein LOC120627827 isoform X2 [Pararge aegeria]|uniref:uncharacterized protein LOC120627827 isoform X2 n=1 Tax=Pararge aegeria TaxID=116150 RepID=UPI0019D0603F|nr:uncharacterized protein LOC120627827 isoform X2 [Pararge aegeria]
MFGYLNCFYVHAAVVILIIETCISEPQTPYLALYSPGDTEYTDVLVRRAHDNLTLVCEVRGEPAPRVFVWNYVSDNDNDTDSGRPFATEPSGKTGSSRLERTDLQLSDSGHYICSAPPFSSTKYVLVQPRGPSYCARGAFWCGSRCVLPAYVCDGRRDCEHAEDERPPLCAPQPCARSDKLNCSSGRCIPEAACCRAGAPLCPQPTCCNEHPRYSTLEGYVEVEYPPLFEDRHAPDEYGFIQSTIYTVTACALIFMIAVVLLVSALCKMHLKRVALRGYAAAHRDTAHHYAARYPPRYEAARLLEPGVSSSPVRNTLCASELPSPETPSTGASEALEPPPYTGGFGLARLSAIFCSRYRQVPTQCCDVELTAAGARAPHDDLFFAEPEPAPRDLDYMAAPVEFFRRRAARRNTIERVMEQLGAAPRPPALQLGRFQLSLPRFRRDLPRPDTPNVAELTLDLRLPAPASPDTYTLNGRTVRLLGAACAPAPPPYCEAVRYKCGPPPPYRGADSECAARSNVELPPRYDDLAALGPAADTDAANNNVAVAAGARPAADDAAVDAARYTPAATDDAGDIIAGSDVTSNGLRDSVSDATTVNDNDLFIGNDSYPETISSVIDNLPAIDSDVNANDTLYGSSAAITT